MSDIEATKFYIRHREGYPETELQDSARRGFWTLNVETQPFEWGGEGDSDIDDMHDLSPTIGIAGYIGDIHAGLRRMGKRIPANVDYPPELKEFLGRDIVEGTLGDVRSRPGRPAFVKPIEHKLFTGFVYSGDSESRRRVVTLPDEVPVLMCEPIVFLSEYRSMILDGEVLDCRRYKGDYGLAPYRKIVEAGVLAMRGHSPRAFCLDWGVTQGGETLLVEMNEGFCFGPYGMLPHLYARMLSARWHEMTSA